MNYNRILITKVYDSLSDLSGSSSPQDFIEWLIAEKIPLEDSWIHQANKGDIYIRYYDENPTQVAIEENLGKVVSSIAIAEAELAFLYLQQEELRQYTCNKY